jgi:hypothetical protein
MDDWLRAGIEDEVDVRFMFPDKATFENCCLSPLGLDESETRLTLCVWSSILLDADAAMRERAQTLHKERQHRVQPPPTATVLVKHRMPLPSFTTKRHRISQVLDTAVLAGPILPATEAPAAPPALGNHRYLQEVWEIYLQVSTTGTMWQEVEISLMDDLRDLILRPLRRVPDDRMRSLLGGLRRWLLWLSKTCPGNMDARFSPPAVLLGKYLTSVAAGGPTAAAAAWHHLAWWEVHLGIPFNTAHGCLVGFKLHDLGHTPRQAEVLQPAELYNLLQLVACSSGSVQLFAGAVLHIACGCIRWRHVQRSAVTSKPGAEWPTFRCAMGKRTVNGARPGFDWACPKLCWRSTNISDLFVTWLREALPEGEQFLVLRPEPRRKGDFGLTSGTAWMSKPMHCATFLELFRGLLVLCGMPVQMAAARTYNALRRCMPTAANVLRLSDPDAQALGNWVEIPKGSGDPGRGRAVILMSHHYAASKLSQSALIKTWVLERILQGCKRAALDPAKMTTIRHRGTNQSFQAFRQDAFTWDDLARMQEEPELQAVQLPEAGLPLQEEAPSDSSSASTVSGDDESDASSAIIAEGLCTSIRWFQQGKSVHLARSDAADEGVTPMCFKAMGTGPKSPG